MKRKIRDRRHPKKYPRTQLQRYRAMVFTCYGIREDDIVALMDRQRGCCAICGASLVNPEWRKGDMHIDHDHTSGVIRGLLCCHCNHLLGVSREDIRILDSAAKYLKTHSVSRDRGSIPGVYHR